MSQGTVTIGYGNTLSAARLIVGGYFRDFCSRVEQFENEVKNIVGKDCEEASIESIGSGVVCRTMIRCANSTDADQILQNFKNNGWKLK
jgi:uncharacterized protein (UPF0335 family)